MGEDASMKQQKKWWLLERHNPQLGVYWIPLGQLARSTALARENTLYGTNYVHPFDSLKEYQEKCAELRSKHLLNP